ncbi:MAG: helix-turn-helix transcriptional regulator [Segetibacter sp.]
MRNDPSLTEMGKKMKLIRKFKKITLRELGQLCKLDYSAIARIECGQKSSRILTLKAIADVLEVDVKDFI